MKHELDQTPGAHCSM